MTRRGPAVALLVLVLSLLPAPVPAITNGQADLEAHPSVGLVVQTLGPDACNPVSRVVGCSGVLVAPDVFLTDGLCSEAYEFNVQNGFADRTWLILDPDPLIPGSAIPTIDCADFIAVAAIVSSPAHNAGVLLLEEPQAGVRLAVLPAANSVKKIPRRPAALTLVGYGALSDPADPSLPDYSTFARRFALARIDSVSAETHTATLEPNPDGSQPCVEYASTAGAAFLGNTDTVLSLTKFPRACVRSLSFQRLDVASVRDFLASYVSLP